MDDEEGAKMMSAENQSRLETSGWTPHRLRLKSDTLAMRFRSLDATHGLCNGARLILRQCPDRVIEAEVSNGNHAGYVAIIRRILLVTEQSGFALSGRKRQILVRMAYAIAINTLQGQTFRKVGIPLASDVFLHGQSYVVLSRATATENMSILLLAHSTDRQRMRNVVGDEALR